MASRHDVLASRPRASGAGCAADIERATLQLAARQHGVVTRAQLIGVGLSPESVDRRLAAGRLTALHRGVYRVGPPVAPRAREMAAVLACGDTAVLSHGSGADLWRIMPPIQRRRLDRRQAELRSPGLGPQRLVPPGGSFPVRDLVDVTVVGPIRRRPGIRVHRVRNLPADEMTCAEGVPVTTPARTIVDLAAWLESRELERAVAEALALRATTEEGLRSVAARYARRPGVWRLRSLLNAEAAPARTRSRAEGQFLELVLGARLPRPEVNVRIGRHEVDFFWAAQRLAVEIDGYAYHSSRASFEADRRRDADLVQAGIRVIRFTWRQLRDELQCVVGGLARALGRAEGEAGAAGRPGRTMHRATTPSARRGGLASRFEEDTSRDGRPPAD